MVAVTVWLRAALLLFALGATLGTALDAVHVHTRAVPGTGLGLLLACTTALTGSAIEAAQIEAGIFSYLAPDRWGIPCWLPCLYACAQVAIGNLGRRLVT